MWPGIIELPCMARGAKLSCGAKLWINQFLPANLVEKNESSINGRTRKQGMHWQIAVGVISATSFTINYLVSTRSIKLKMRNGFVHSWFWAIPAKLLSFGTPLRDDSTCWHVLLTVPHTVSAPFPPMSQQEFQSLDAFKFNYKWNAKF